MSETLQDDRGALVGWKALPFRDRVILQMESVSAKRSGEDGDVRTFTYVLDRNQAVQLGNYLFKVTGQTAPLRKRKGLIERVMGV